MHLADLLLLLLAASPFVLVAGWILAIVTGVRLPRFGSGRR